MNKVIAHKMTNLLAPAVQLGSGEDNHLGEDITFDSVYILKLIVILNQ